MPRTAATTAPITKFEVRLGRHLSVRRFAGMDADHALLVHQTMGGPAADGFCVRHAARAVDVWRIPEPAGDELQASINESVAVGHHITESSALPVFVHGSSRAAAMTYRALQASDIFNGAVLVVDAIAARDLMRSPAQGGVVAAIPLAQNTKPILYVVAEGDHAVAETVRHATGGPVEVHLEPGGIDEVMQARTHSDIVLEWCVRQLSNHFNPASRTK
ncbi:hypothetical protein [Mycobacterium sp. URHB0044]|jgi:hypothetical protein|uniref:hypothetical protein n=1 Tax=Mycobacterium sp. URHB0044 TaxID=1380386 RepID=UPI0004902C77|nr:hypothetical protein [Mycobacterium sp. URHB0044]